ncbi:short transient receptor potential channel 4-like isoform X2 [Clavelina lepadiformis]|uniref:short transient receptor potential channel 4-like isoform X2 n=1 Tax=Clavelina lepadiformis TaxID=159417 RepID=UPI0040414FFB
MSDNGTGCDNIEDCCANDNNNRKETVAVESSSNNNTELSELIKNLRDEISNGDKTKCEELLSKEVQLSVHSFRKMSKDENNRDKQHHRMIFETQPDATNGFHEKTYFPFPDIDQDLLDQLENIFRNDDLTKEIQNPNTFTIGTAVMVMAATLEKHNLLEKLYANGHRLQEANLRGMETVWEYANIWKAVWIVKTSPAYIRMISKQGNLELQVCMDQIKNLRKNAKLRHEFSDFCKLMEKQLEDYMCSLLDRIQSTKQLAELFGFSVALETAKVRSQATNDENPKANWIQPPLTRNYFPTKLELLEEACELHLVDIVTHHNTQLALGYIRYRNFPRLWASKVHGKPLGWKLIGLLFPVLSLFYIIAPQTNIGGIISQPNVLYECHLASDVTFIGILVTNVVTKSAAFEYLGASPTLWEWLALSWIVGKWVQEIEEFFKRGPRRYFGDWWNYNDLLQLVFFTICIILRVIDYVKYGNVPADERIFRPGWSASEPRLISSGIMACVYVFVSLRLLGLIKIHRVLGPLQVSLARMLIDVIQFLLIFALVIFPFSLGMTEIFWYHETPQWKDTFCGQTENGTSCSSDVYFGNLPKSLLDLFWTLFGYVDPYQIALEQQTFVQVVGIALLAIYHVIAIIIILNMLIAMMSKSYEDTSEKEEKEWKFSRTVTWIHFIRRDVTRPPPMNLIPSPWLVAKYAKKIRERFQKDTNNRNINDNSNEIQNPNESVAGSKTKEDQHESSPC